MEAARLRRDRAENVIEIRAVAESSAAAETVAAAARDFSERRSRIWPNVNPGRFTVHASGHGYAEVTEDLLRGLVWERCRYRWPTPTLVEAIVLDSNVLATGSTWTLEATPRAGGGCRVEALFVRRFRPGPRARAMRLLVRLAGRALVSSDLRRALRTIEG